MYPIFIVGFICKGYVCVCVCVCVRERKRERETQAFED